MNNNNKSKPLRKDGQVSKNKAVSQQYMSKSGKNKVTLIPVTPPATCKLQVLIKKIALFTKHFFIEF